MSKTNLNFEFDVRIPDALVQQMMDGEITCAMLVTMTILYKWANWSTGRVKWVSSGGLRTASHKAYSDRTFRISLQRLEEMGWITRHMVPGSHKDYAVTINNYKVVDDAGKVIILNPRDIKVSDPYAVMPCREGSQETSHEGSQEGSQETSQKDLLNHLPNLLPEHKPELLPVLETKEVRKEPLLASLVAEAVGEEQGNPSNPSRLKADEADRQKQNQEPEPEEDLHPACWSVRRMWLERTGHLLSLDDMYLANKLILAYRYRVVEAVLRNTLWTRPKSAKLRWNKFSIFAKHWERNHEEYLAWVAANPKLSHGIVKKFDTVPLDSEIDPKEWVSLVKWFKEHKNGVWEFGSDEWKAMGFTHGQVYTALKYCGEEGLGVTKATFVSLLYEVAGLREPGAENGLIFCRKCDDAHPANQPCAAKAAAAAVGVIEREEAE